MSYSPQNPNGSATSANSQPVVIASDQAALPLPTGAATAAKQPALGTAGSASADVISVQGVASMTALKVDGSATTQPISAASLPLPSSAATSTKQSDGSQKTQVVDGSGNVIGATSNALDINIKSGNPTSITANAGTNLNTSALALDATLTGGTQVAIAKGAAASGASKSGNPVQTGAVYNSTQPTVTTGQVVENQATARGAQIVAPGVDNFAVQATLAAETTKVIGAVNNLPATVDTNSGNKSASTVRVVLATDQPALTNKLLVTPDSVALPANQSVNVSQINGVTPLMGNGVTGTGSQRVTIASDNTAFTVNAAQSGTWTVQPGNTANSTPWLVADTPATSGGLSIVTGSVGATVTAIKASAGQLYGYHLFNTTAAVAYVQIFNLGTGSVTLGTTAPTFSIGIPASGGVTVNFDKGIAFGTAISYACTTTRTGSSGATCDVNFFYK